MLAAKAILISPTALTTQFKVLRLPNRNFVPRLDFSRRFISKKSLFLDIRDRRPRVMADAGAEMEGDRVGALEQEAFVNGYPKFEAQGLEATLNDMSKWLVTVFFGAILLWRHDAESLWAAIGSALNAALSTLLKRILNQERPVSNLRSDPGMPSSHAQSIFFTVVFAIVSMTESFGINGLTTTLSGLVVVLGIYLSWLRISQRLHTVSQVTVGGIIGFMFALSWFWLWDTVVLKAFIAHIWIRIVVVLGAVGFSVAFLLYLMRYWVLEEQ